MAETIHIRMTVDEFEQLPERDDLIELIEGEVVVKGSPKTIHQRVVFNIATKLRHAIANGEVFIAPLSVRLDNYNSFQPDVFWISGNNPHCEIQDDQIIGSPDLVVEVISPGSAKMDRGTKFQKYQEHGVREYWIIEPELAFLQVWILLEGRYTQQGIFESGEEFTSVTLETSITLSDVFVSKQN